MKIVKPRRPFKWLLCPVEVTDAPKEFPQDEYLSGNFPPKKEKVTRPVWLLIRRSDREILAVVSETELLAGPKAWLARAIVGGYEHLYADCRSAKSSTMRAFEKAHQEQVVGKED